MNRKTGKFCLVGFKLSRIQEWMAVVKTEGRVIPWPRIAFALGAGVLTLGGVGKRRWRGRMKACMWCPVYNREAKACRPFAGSPIGCGCYMPFKALTRKNACWAQTVKPGGPWGFKD